MSVLLAKHPFFDAGMDALLAGCPISVAGYAHLESRRPIPFVG